MAARKQLGTILVESGIITVKTLERALERQKGSGKRLGIVLEEMGVINEQELYDKMNLMVDNLDALVKDFKENPRKYIKFSVF